MKPLSLGAICCLALIACSSENHSKQPPTITYTFSTSSEAINNPERGFFTPIDLPDTDDLSSIRSHGQTLIHIDIHLDQWRNQAIPAEALLQIQSIFDTTRQQALKAIIRFSYNQGPYPNSQPDASKSQILAHITQLTPILQNNQDVIAWAEAGFIGAWGEWHTSTNGLDNLTDKQEILQAFRQALPNTRYIQLRYPNDLIAMYSQPSLAYGQKIGHHNDCFLASEDDNGTYNRNDQDTKSRDVAYLSELNQHAPMSGETCAVYPARTNCSYSKQELKQLGFSAISADYHPDVIQGWKNEGCYQDIHNQLGYRLALLSAEISGESMAGARVNFKLTLQNSGYAAVINERPVYLVIHQSSIHYKIKLNADPRHWNNGTHTVNETIALPAPLEKGRYQLSLWLPDNSASLQNNPLYAIRLANLDMWDNNTGYNWLGTIAIK